MHDTHCHNPSGRLVVDTDGGVDDFLAIIAAARARRGDIIAITATGGAIAPRKALRNALLAASVGGLDVRRLLAGVGIGISFAGRTYPSIGQTYHSREGITLPARILSSVEMSHKLDDAAEVLRRCCEGGPFTLICIGPLTNLARFCQLEPAASRCIERVVAMAGVFQGPGSVAVSVDGELRRLAEYNVFSDPEGAQYAFAHMGKKILIVPKDLCDRVFIRAPEIRRRLRGSRIEHQLVREWLEFRLGQAGKSTKFGLSDPLVMAVACGLCRYTELDARVQVNVCDGPYRGTTRLDPSGCPVRLAQHLDVRQVRGELWKYLFEAPPAV